MEPIYTVARRLPKKAARIKYDLLNSLLATAEREICFFYKLYILHKNGKPASTKCSHGHFRNSRYTYITGRETRHN